MMESLLAQKLPVAVVTFSPQVRLIREVLVLALGREAGGRVAVVGSDRAGDSQSKGKQPHIQTAQLDLALQLPIAQVLLIDDDKSNIKNHRMAGGAVIHVRHKLPERELWASIQRGLQALSPLAPQPIKASVNLAVSSPVVKEEHHPSLASPGVRNLKELDEIETLLNAFLSPPTNSVSYTHLTLPTKRIV
eukprot:TRINITY_DN50929_c0_g2_i1.p1 TRINITY_DN50929_c0_g2~~TRINITY_DN50929_c0_g2_i1.p1  ORF type:complete len:191 (-),score=46.25 TRINITY_DN50929_c0_g2_i1:116-688(-)